MIVKLEEEHLNCSICSEPFTWDFDSKKKNHLPVLSSSQTCDHYFCLGCVLDQQASLAEEMPHAPKWIRCMTCMTATSFRPDRPKFHRLLIDLLCRGAVLASADSNKEPSLKKESSSSGDEDNDPVNLMTYYSSSLSSSKRKISAIKHDEDCKDSPISSVNHTALVVDPSISRSNVLGKSTVTKKKTTAASADTTAPVVQHDGNTTRNTGKKERSSKKQKQEIKGGGRRVIKEATRDTPQDHLQKKKVDRPFQEQQQEKEQEQSVTAQLPKSIDAIIRYMDKIYPAKPGYHSFYVSQQDSRAGCSKTRKKLRDFARKYPQDPAISHYVLDGKWDPPNQATLDLMVNLLKTMIVLKKK